MGNVKIDFIYEAIVRLEVTASTEGKTSARAVEVEYNHNLFRDDWRDSDGRFTEKGINALLFGFCNGLTATIHSAGQINGMDTAKLLRWAISIIEEQFVQQVKVSMSQVNADKSE